MKILRERTGRSLRTFGLLQTNLSGGGSSGFLAYPWDFPEVLDYWDARYGITQSGERVSDVAATLRGVDSLAQATGANQPIYLPYTSEKYLYIPGVNNNIVSQPDRASFATGAGSFSCAMRLACDSWASGSNQRPLGQNTNNTTNLAWFLNIGTTGLLGLNVSSDGTTAVAATTSSVTLPSVGAVDREYMWIMAAWNNAGGVVNYYYAADSATIPAAWTLLGTADRALASLTLFDSTAALTAGGFGSGVAGAGMKIKRALYWSGVVAADGTGGTLLADMDATAQAEGASSWTDPTSGGTWTVGTSGAKPAQVVARPWVLHDASAYYMRATFTLNQPCGVVFCGRQNAATNTRALWDGATNGTTARLRQNTVVTGGIQLIAPTADTVDGNFALSTKMVVGSLLSGASSYMQVNQNSETASSPGTNNMDGITVGADSATVPTLFSALQWTAMAVINQSMTAVRMRTLIAAMQREYQT